MKTASYKLIIFFIPILLLSILMRFYNIYNFQYFSGDEEIFHAILRRIVVEGKLLLVVPNAQVGGSIGAFFHLISSPIFFLTKSNPLLVPLFGSALGVVTTLVMYWVGNLIAGRRLGLMAATLYAGSFLVALFDRKLWPLTPDPLLILLGIGALIQIVRKKFKYALLLAITVSFAWQADPTAAVVLLGAILSFVFFRLPLWKKEYLFSLIYLIFSILPLIIFEIRHPGTIFRPLFLHLIRRGSEVTKVGEVSTLQLNNILENLSRSLFIAPSNFMEQYFCYCSTYPKPPFSPVPEILTLLFLISVFIWIFLHKKDAHITSAVTIVLIFLIAFLAGISLYNIILKSAIYQHYFVTAFPPFLLLVAFSLERISKTRWALLTWVFLIIFISSNLFTLFHSSLKYPVWQKLELVNKLIPYIETSTFSVYGHGERYMTDGGWTTFFIWQGHNPSRSYLNGGWDWIYRSHSLYTTNPDQGEGNKIIIFHDINYSFDTPTQRVGNISATIFNSSKK